MSFFQKNKLLIFVLFAIDTHCSLELLRQKYPWPLSKPRVQKDDSSLFVNQRQLKAILNGNHKIIIELGSWYGASTRFLLDNAPNATVIAVDHWLGSIEHHIPPFDSAKLPYLYETFLVNCWNYKDRLIPLRATTLEGLDEIYMCGIKPDLIYIDAGHTYKNVLDDLEKSYLLFPDAFIMGDDWLWQSVAQAVTDFAKKYSFKISTDSTFWTLKK